jgi:hypothetical protein
MGEETLQPAPIDIIVADEDIRPFREAFDRKYGRLSIALNVAVIAVVVTECIFLVNGRHNSTLLLVQSLFVMASSVFSVWSARVRLQDVARTFSVTPASTGIDVATAFTGKPARHYPWATFRSVRDTGSVLLLVPKFGKQIVIPKRCLDDDGKGLLHAFETHAVATRYEMA